MESYRKEIDRAQNESAGSADKVIEIECSKLKPNPFQPRLNFDPETIKDLAESIAQFGQLQPIAIAKDSDTGGKGYVILAGERRWRACQLLKKPVKCVILENRGAMEFQIAALQENLLRDNLHPIELALGMQRMVETGVINNWEGFESLGGFHGRTIRRYSAITKLSAKVMALAIEIGYRNITVLERIARYPRTQAQHQVLKKIAEEGLSQKDALEYIKGLAQTAKQEDMESKGIIAESDGDLTAKMNTRGKIAFSWSPSDLNFKNAPNKFRAFQEALKDALNELEGKFAKA